MRLVNSTELSTGRLERLFKSYVSQWPRFSKLEVRVRYSRGADFSGACYYSKHIITVNIGRHVRFPYGMKTYVARAQSNATHWWKQLHTVRLEDPYQLALFVFLHEFYHYLIKRAGRNTRRKESMCDRFAVRALIDRFGVVPTDAKGLVVPRDRWDFQNLERFVEAVWSKAHKPQRLPRKAARSSEEQLWLWPNLP